MIELAPGRTLADGRYTLERLLGSGGMATVWLARDERLDRMVAVKLLSDALAHDRSYVQRFAREARIAAQLWHPNLVQVYDFDADGDRPLLVMEVVDGPTLAELQRAPDRAGIDVARLAEELLGALAHIHAAGVVHRDVKPANVLIGADGRARLTDFGIAQPEEASRLTMTGGVVGTLGYLAPEVVTGGRATPQSDLYSTGVVLSALLEGEPEGGGDPRLATLIDRLTRHDPQDRPKSAQDALDLLARPPDADTAPTRVAPGDIAPTRVAPTRVAPGRRAATASPRRSSALADRLRPLARAAIARIGAHPLGLTVSGFLAGALIVAIIIALSGGGSAAQHSVTPGRAGVPRADAPLADQLRAIDRTLSSLPRR